MHFVEFLQALHRFRHSIGARRLTLLAHSMGNYVLGFGVEHAAGRNQAVRRGRPGCRG
jgi:esterase/lipase superfamily enzyme